MVRRTLRWLKRLVKPVHVVGKPSHTCPTLRIGTDYGGWVFNHTLVKKDSIVYSFGIGEDASWDLGMIKRFGVTIHGFDPTPKSIRWVKAQNMPAEFVMHDFGLAPKDGELVFHAPINPNHVSLSVVERETQTERIVLPVRELAGIMKELGHDHIDILKMDIEGSEYEVIEDLLANGLAVKPAKNQGPDVATLGGRTVTFDGLWRKAKIPEADYTAAFAAAEQEYTRLLGLLLAQAAVK